MLITTITSRCDQLKNIKIEQQINVSPLGPISRLESPIALLDGTSKTNENQQPPRVICVQQPSSFPEDQPVKSSVLGPHLLSKLPRTRLQPRDLRLLIQRSQMHALLQTECVSLYKFWFIVYREVIQAGRAICIQVSHSFQLAPRRYFAARVSWLAC
ncbi:hypothetical protein SS50377_25104 [Spironucleus salmonicida]|uniref:Uncharacterized protein n=1 Tax=Spironucleus salmonicida TaxID=348837 RepID=V6LK63_9EUKA|nr:hypothetical protein SS50377_25104 [Spironucleus salmonicida]|eukprot:EST44713.1 Hypothetical protein SS50377_15425 [Spironucleus salmonicida]